VYATNHKDIGTMYLVFAFTMFMVGGVLALIIRAELFQPGLQFVNPQLFNQLTTMHGLIMVFGAIMPAFVGFANWMVPLQIGAPDMAFARMNNLSFWLLIPAAVMLVSSFFLPGGAPAAGWTLYAPLTLQMGPSMDSGIFALHILGASSIMGSINIIVTILNMRAPGMTLMKMPLFCWTWLITACLLIAVMPVLAGAITMTLTDRHFGTKGHETLVDRVVRLEKGKRIAALKNVTINEAMFQVHFSHRPLAPGVLILEAMASTRVVIV
jgi:cytochrome c oxidase subunit 1